MTTPFRRIDIIGAMAIVLRIRSKIIRSVLYNIVCNNCAHMNRPNSSLDSVLSHWAHFTVLRFIFTARRIASAVLATAIPSVRLSVCPSVRHTPVLCQNDGT